MIKCIAVDDETPALDILEDNIRRVPFLQLVRRCKNAFEAAEALRDDDIGLMFLDIQMPGIRGTDFLRNLSSRPLVIFITAYRKYAVDGFDLDVLDYLVKPVSFERFLKSVKKAEAYFNRKEKEESEQNKLPGYLFVNTEYNILKIEVDKIAYIEGLKNYIKIHLVNGSRPVLTKLTMKAAEEKLSPDKCIRVHKSFIILLDKITSFRRDSIRIGEKDIPVGKSYRDNFFKRINEKGYK